MPPHTSEAVGRAIRMGSQAPSASASAPTSWLGLGNLLDLSALHPGGGGYEDDAECAPRPAVPPDRF